jgi:hypothetical protein
MTTNYKLPNTNGMLQAIKDLELESKKADELNDKGAYNRLIALKINIREFLLFFERREQK